MLLGEYVHAIDEDGRIVMPRPWRQAFGDGGYAVKGRGRCIGIYPHDEFDRVAEYVRTRARMDPTGATLQGARTFFAGAEELKLDRRGRFRLYGLLYSYAGLRLGSTSPIVLAGAHNRVELWSPTRWSERHTSDDPSDPLTALDLGPEPALHSIYPGILGPDGTPLSEGSADYETIVSDIRSSADQLVDVLAANPRAMHRLSPRQFEEAVAELLARQGYEVSLTRGSQDGGIDVVAVDRNSLGSFLYVVQCKRNAFTNPVGIEVVRELYGVVDFTRASAGIVVTSSVFTRGAKEFRHRVPFKMSLRDYYDLEDWLSRSSRQAT